MHQYPGTVLETGAHVLPNFCWVTNVSGKIKRLEFKYILAAVAQTLLWFATGRMTGWFLTKLLSPCYCIQIGFGSYPASYSVLGALFLGIKWAQYEVGCLPPSRADVKNAQSYTVMPPYFVVAWWWIKHKTVTYEQYRVKYVNEVRLFTDWSYFWSFGQSLNLAWLETSGVVHRVHWITPPLITLFFCARREV